MPPEPPKLHVSLRFTPLIWATFARVAYAFDKRWRPLIQLCGTLNRFALRRQNVAGALRVWTPHSIVPLGTTLDEDFFCHT